MKTAKPGEIFQQPKRKLGHIVTVADEQGVQWKICNELPHDDGFGPRITFFRCEDGRGWSIPWANILSLADPQEFIDE